MLPKKNKKAQLLVKKHLWDNAANLLVYGDYRNLDGKQQALAQPWQSVGLGLGVGHLNLEILLSLVLYGIADLVHNLGALSDLITPLKSKWQSWLEGHLHI